MQNDYERKINECLQLQHRTADELAKVQAQMEWLRVRGYSSQPRAGVQGSSSSSTNQAPGLRSPAQQQAQQQVCGEETTIG